MAEKGGLRGRNVGIVEEFFARLEALDVNGFVGLWAEDGVQEMPFAPEGFPSRLDGKEAVRGQYGGMPRAYARMEFSDRTIRPMLDPEWVVAEYRGEIDLVSGGTYNNRYVGVFRIVDGKVVHFTEYFDPNVLAESFGGGEALKQAFSLPEDR